jgi:hypothetical protein
LNAHRNGAGNIETDAVQLPILRSLALVAVGNAVLGGRDITGFWPDDPMFRYTSSLDFLTPREGGPLKHVASGPPSWFEKLAARGCTGLRLHNAPMQQNQKLGHIQEHVLVGLVGGGPRWLIEPVYGDHSEVWEGFDRVGDQNAPDKKIWLSAYILIGEAEPTDPVDTDVAGASATLRDALISIETVARAMPGAPFADQFVAGRRALDGHDSEPAPDFVRFTQLTPEATRLLQAAGRAWVFGGMGSWNDIAPEAGLKPSYERASKSLFAALQRAVLVVGNSTYRG